MYCSTSKSQEHFLENEYAYLQHINPTTKFVSGPGLRRKLNTPFFTKAIVSPNRGVSVNPLQFTQNIARAAAGMGVRIFEHTPVSRARGDPVQKNHLGH